MCLSAEIVWLDVFSALCGSLVIQRHICVAKETFDRIRWLSSNSHKSLKGGRNILGGISLGGIKVWLITGSFLFDLANYLEFLKILKRVWSICY